MDRMRFEDIQLDDSIKGILIDFDNTLYEYAPCHEKALKEAHAVFNKNRNMPYDEFASLYSASQKDVKSRVPGQAACHSRLLYFQTLIETIEGKTDILEIIRLEEAYWSSFRKVISIRKASIDFLTSSKKAGLKICFVTDLTTHIQFLKMAETGVAELADFIVTSEEAGAEKPDPKIFLLALKKLDLSTNEVIMIGDDEIKDFEGAKKLGIKSYLI